MNRDKLITINVFVNRDIFKIRMNKNAQNVTSPVPPAKVNFIYKIIFFTYRSEKYSMFNMQQ